MTRRPGNSLRLGGSVLISGLLLLTGVATAQPVAPRPNPLATVSPGGNPIFAPGTGADISANGEAASLHGNPARGREVFAHSCIVCHGDRGTGGVLNTGSDDGTVPPLNPIDPSFLQDAGGDPEAFARDIDVFVQHGSRPAGPNPRLSMIPWGDKRLLSQRDIANVEAYVMELNGVTWPDRWAPPAEVREEMTSADDLITYTITLVNQGGSALSNLHLQDTLPSGLAYVTSYVPSPGRNPGKLSGSTVEWTNLDGVAQSATLGPFVVVVRRTGSVVLPNVAQLFFSWSTPDGMTHWSSAVSNPTLPGPKAASSLFSLTPAVPIPRLSSSSTVPTPVVKSAISAVAPAIADVASPATSTPQSVPTVVPTPLTTAMSAASERELPPTPTTTMSTPVSTPIVESPTPSATLSPPATPTPATFGIQIIQPGSSASAWGYTPPTAIVHVGDTVAWSNTGTLPHSVTADDASFDSGLLNPGAGFSITFTTAGAYSFHCAPHPWMKGTVVVQGGSG